MKNQRLIQIQEFVVYGSHLFSVPIDTGGSLTDAEKMLLLMCQSQSVPTKDETDMSSKVDTEINTTSSSPKNDIIQEEGTTNENGFY